MGNVLTDEKKLDIACLCGITTEDNTEILSFANLMRKGREFRRLKINVHAPCCSRGTQEWESGKQEWIADINADAEAMLLIAALS